MPHSHSGTGHPLVPQPEKIKAAYLSDMSVSL